jgi:hypothetical protein
MNDFTHDPAQAHIFKETDLDWWGCLLRARTLRERVLQCELKPFQGPSFETRNLGRGSYRIYFYDEQHQRSYVKYGI